MRATVYRGSGDVRVENVPDPVVKQPTDAAMDKREAIKVMVRL